MNENEVEKVIEDLLQRQERINLWVLRKIAKDVKETLEMTPSDAYRLEAMLRAGASAREINAYLISSTQLQLATVQEIIRSAAAISYADVKPLYDYRELAYIPFDENEGLQTVVRAISERVTEDCRHLWKTQAFMLRDPANPEVLIPTSPSEAYNSIMDEAVQSVILRTEDPQAAIRRTMRQLIGSGLSYVEYHPESGRRFTQRLETAVRRNILDGVRAINQGVQDEVGRQFGADGKEITVHAYPAPDHAPVQGHQFDNAEFDRMQNGLDFQDIHGRHFKAFKRAIGTLNCRHFTFSIIIGYSTPNYSDEQLQRILDENEKGYTDKDGRHYTMYECTQVQRKLETEIRRAKSGYMTAKAEGDTELMDEYAAKVDRKLSQYKSFSRACGLGVKGEKLFVSGYKR